MGQVSAKLRSIEGGYAFWCAGCGETHGVRVGVADRPCWTFDGNVDRPTFSPSILVTGLQSINDERGDWTGEYRRGPDGKPLKLTCHSFVTAGRMQFLADCTHALAGQTIDLPDLPGFLCDAVDP
jgi:hypothetical protein